MMSVISGHAIEKQLKPLGFTPKNEKKRALNLR